VNQYFKSYGEPGERDIRVHIINPGMDVGICGLDAVGDDMVHDKEPKLLPGGRKYKVTCEHCLRIISAVKDYLS
jgi:hypothetical protein